MQRIFIRYLGGSRANQADEFFQSAQDLIAGRDAAAHIRFDPDRDDLVSRQHLKITTTPGGAFQLVDLQSRNGTFLNHQRVFGAVALNHNDVVQLGAGGPEFRFEMDPPPMLPPSLPMGAAGAKATRVSWMPEPPAGAPRPVGRATVERMLGDVFTRMRQDGRRSLWVAITAVAVLGALVLGSWWYLGRSRAQLQSSLSAVAQKSDETQQHVEEEMKKAPQALEEGKKQVEILQAQLRMSDQRNSESQNKLAQELALAQNRLTAMQRMMEQQRAKQADPPKATAPQAPVVQAPVVPVPVVPYDTALADAADKLEKGQASAALEIALRLTQQDPSRWDAYGVAGECYAQQNDLKLAEDMFQRAIAHSSGEVRSVLEERLKALRERDK